jgi:integrase/recombinase XerC
MKLEEMCKLFLDSRKRGVSGARKKCRPKTIKIYRDNLDLFFNFLTAELGIADYKDIRKVSLVQFLDLMDTKVESGQWSKATMQQILRSLKAFFRWVDMDEDCTDLGLKGLQKYLPSIGQNVQRTDIPQNKDLKDFRNGFDTHSLLGFRDYVACSLMLDTGIRAGEACNLLLEHLLLEDRLIVVTGKTDTRVVSLTKEMVRLLNGWLKRRRTLKQGKTSPYVFVSRTSPSMTVPAVCQVFRKHRLKLGLPRITAHIMRHSFATNYLRKGGNMEKLRLMTGHKDYAMLKNYLHLAHIGSPDLKEELEKVSLLKEIGSQD